MSTTLPNPSSAVRKEAFSILLTIFHGLLVAFAFVLSFAAYWFGFLFNALFLLLLAMVAGVIVSRIAGLGMKTLEFGFVRRPFAPAFRKHLLQCLNNWFFL